MTPDLLLESACTGLGLNLADIWVKNQKKDYVEDEVYFLCQRHKNGSRRKTLYDSLKNSNILLSLDSVWTFFELMTNNNKTVKKAISKYIKECSIIIWVLKWYLILQSNPLVVYAVTDADFIKHVCEYCVCICVSVWKGIPLPNTHTHTHTGMGFVHMFVVCHWFAYNPYDGYICNKIYCILFYNCFNIFPISAGKWANIIETGFMVTISTFSFS